MKKKKSLLSANLVEDQCSYYSYTDMIMSGTDTHRKVFVKHIISNMTPLKAYKK